MKPRHWITLAVVSLILAGVISCTTQQMARQYGGTDTMNLPKGEKLVTVTWHGNDIWYLTRPMRADENPEVYSLKESSNFGIWQGAVVVRESR